METRSGRRRGLLVPDSPARSVSPSRGTEIDLNEIDPELMFQHLIDLGRIPREAPTPEPASRPRTSGENENPQIPTSSIQLQQLEALLRQLLASASTAPATQPMAMAASTSTANSTGKPQPKFPDPPHYEGDPAKLDGWVTQMSMYLRAYDVDLASVRAVEMASMFLRGKALDWWTSQFHLMTSKQIPPLGSWDAFVKALTDAFRPIELARRHVKELLNVSQGRLDMRSYISTFNAARAKVPGALSDETLCYVFLQGCRVDLQKSIIVQNPRTLDEYFSLAVALSDLSGTVPSTTSKKQEKASKDPSKPVCTHCGKANHSVEQCFKLHPELKKKSSKKT